MGVLSQRDQRVYRDTKIEVADDVDRASEALERAQKRARVANGLLISGAAATAAGATALLFSYLRPRPDARQVRMGVSPTRSGVALSLCGAWQGGL
jgi:precorrin-3B methylase